MSDSAPYTPPFRVICDDTTCDVVDANNTRLDGYGSQREAQWLCDRLNATPPAPIPAMGARDAAQQARNIAILECRGRIRAILNDGGSRHDMVRALEDMPYSTPCPSPSEGLTEEERQLLVGALNSAEQLMLNGDEYSRGRARDLVIGVRRKLDRLVSLALPADLAGLVDRLRDWAALVQQNATSSVFVSEEFRAEHREKAALLSEAVAAITALSARVQEMEAQAALTRRLALEEAGVRLDEYAAALGRDADTIHKESDPDLSLVNKAAMVKDMLARRSAVRIASHYVRALSPTLDMDALTARAIEAAQSAYSGAPDSHSQNAANVARAVLSALLEGGE